MENSLCATVKRFATIATDNWYVPCLLYEWAVLVYTEIEEILAQQVFKTTIYKFREHFLQSIHQYQLLARDGNG